MSEWSALLRHPEFRRGAREMASTSPGIAAWGLVTGVAMAKGGLAAGPAIAMSLLCYAGSSQLAALPLIATHAPLWVIWATAFCVNLRFVIFSAQWRPYFGGLPRARRITLGYFLGDLNYVIFMHRFPEPKPHPDQLPYAIGGAATNWLAWQLPSVLGILLADAVPTEWGLGFAGTLALLGLTCSLLVDRVTWLAAGVASAAAVAAFALPFKLHIVVAIAAAVAVGVVADRASALFRRTAT